MDASNLVRALTLWYVVLLFLRTAETSGPVSFVLVGVSTVLAVVLPAYVVLGGVYLLAGE